MAEGKKVFKTDTHGNELYVEDNQIWLCKADKTTSRIGAFDLDNKRIKINKEHYDYNERFKSYPFNEAVLRAAKKCDNVYLICPEGRFEIPIEVILKYGTPLIYEKFGLDRDLYIEVTLIKKYPAVEK